MLLLRYSSPVSLTFKSKLLDREKRRQVTSVNAVGMADPDKDKKKGTVEGCGRTGHVAEKWWVACSSGA